MKQNNEKRVYLDDYISVAKNDMIIRIIFALLVLGIFIYYKVFSYDAKGFFIIILFALCLNVFYFCLTYISILQIKRFLIKEKIYNNELVVDFWNENNAIFINKYIVIFTKFKVINIEYKNIEKAKVLIKRVKGGLYKYLLITLNDKTSKKFLIYDRVHCDIDVNKVLDYLKEKNHEIKFEDSGDYWKYKYNR